MGKATVMVTVMDMEREKELINMGVLEPLHFSKGN
jgi:hypothetical protein